MRTGRITGTGKQTEKELIELLNGYEVEQKRGDLGFMEGTSEIIIESKSPQKDDFGRFNSALNQLKPYLCNVVVFDARRLNLYDCDVFSHYVFHSKIRHDDGNEN